MQTPELFNGPRDPHGFGIEVPPTTVIPTPGGTVVIGHVGYIHGPAGRPCPEYIPTKHELELLARHWFGVRDGLTADFMLTGQTGSDDTREILYSGDRLAAIAAFVGDARMDTLFCEEKAKLLASCSPEDREFILAAGKDSVNFEPRAYRSQEMTPADLAEYVARFVTRVCCGVEVPQHEAEAAARCATELRDRLGESGGRERPAA